MSDRPMLEKLSEKLARFPRTLRSSLCLFLLGGAARGQPIIETERILWKGYPEGIERSHPPGGFELAPDGRGFLYYQGEPWPRLMYQPVDPPIDQPVDQPGKPQAPLMVGPVAPLGGRAPRFSPSGDWIYFTALEGNPRADPSSSATLRAHVVRAAFPSMKVECLFPPQGSSSGSFAVFFDVHPSGKLILLGTGSGVALRDAPHGDYELEVAEISLDTSSLQAGALAALHFRVPGAAPIRYTAGGKSVLYSPQARAGPLERPADIYLFERESRAHRLFKASSFEFPLQAGDFELKSYRVPHLGSFGWDEISTHTLSDGNLGAEGARLRFSREILALSTLPPRPAVLRQGRALLLGGFVDQPLSIIASVETRREARREEEVRRDVDEEISSLLFDPRFLDGTILARRSLEVEPALVDIRSGLEAEKKEPEGRSSNERPLALSAKLLLKDLSAGEGESERLEVLELSPGCFRLERFYDPPRKEEGPASEILLFDGKRSWLKTREGAYLPVSPATFCGELASRSLFRLFLDPAGLGDPRARFESVESAPSPEQGGADLRKIRFSYDDGYRGELFLQYRQDRWLPLSIRSPLLFPSARMRREMGQVPDQKGVTFEDWRPWKGRLVPHRVRFDDGIHPHELELLELSIRSDLTVDLFQPPGSGK